MRVVCISDTHTYGKQIAVPDGDVLVHAGDHTFRGTASEMDAALRWLDSLPHERKVFIAGNHDFIMDDNHPQFFRNWEVKGDEKTKANLLAKYPGLTYLQDSGVEINGFKFWGAPWQPWYWDWAFNFQDGEAGRHQALNTWAKIPDDTNVLITHGPPRGILDLSHDRENKLGCPLLRGRIGQLNELRLHVFGHIHEAYGRLDYNTEPDESGRHLTFVNAAINTLQYDPLNSPIVVDL